MHGIILRKTKVHDCDLITNWLTDDDHITSAYAGHAQDKKRYPNGLEIFTIYEMDTTRTHADNHKSRLDNAYSVEQFQNLIYDSGAGACAAAALEATSDVCPDDSVVIDLFQTTLQTFAVMNTAPNIAPITLMWFECFLFSQMGIMPNMDICAGCGRPLESSTFYQEELGFMCSRCTPGREGNIPEFLLEAVRRLQYQSIRTTVQNALAKSDQKSIRRVATPILRFLASVMCDNSTIKKMSAHKYMADVCLESPGLYDRIVL